MPTDIKLDNKTHDIDLSRTIELHIGNKEVVSQRMKIAILTKQGEWFKNVLEGLPYYTEFFRSKNNKTLIDQFMIEYITQIQDIQLVKQYSSSITPDRKLVIKITVETFSGEIITANLES